MAAAEGKSTNTDKTSKVVPNFATYSPRQRIMAAALKLFVEQGYFNTNIPDLSKGSKCSVGSIYHTFKSKEEVAAALYQEGMRSFRQALDEAISDCQSSRSVITTVVKSFLIFSEVNHQLSKYMWLCRHNEFMSGLVKQPTMVGYDSLGRRLTKAIKEGIRAGEIRKLKANIIWSIVFGVPLAYVRDWLDGYNKVPPSKVAEQIAESCWLALRT